MNIQLRILGLVALGLGLITASAGAADTPAVSDTVDSVEKVLLERWEKVSSLQADLIVEATYAFAPNVPPANVTGRGAAEYLKKGGAPLSRLELVLDMTDTIRLANFVGIYDGKDAYVTRELLGKIETEKVAAGADVGVVPPGGKALFDALRKDFVLTLLPGEVIGGKEVYVMEAKGTKVSSAAVRISKLRLYFSKESGIIVKVIVWNDQGQVLGAITTSNVRINVPIAETRFRYIAPDGTSPSPEPSPQPAPAEATLGAKAAPTAVPPAQPKKKAVVTKPDKARPTAAKPGAGTTPKSSSVPSKPPAAKKLADSPK